MNCHCHGKCYCESYNAEAERKEFARSQLHSAIREYALAYSISLSDAAAAIMRVYSEKNPEDLLDVEGERQFETYNK